MIDRTLVIDFQISALQFERSVLQVTRQLNELAALFEDRDQWYAVNEGQWPDKFIVLNRYLRTGLRPPFIFNN